MRHPRQRPAGARDLLAQDITLAEGPREVTAPDDLAAALSADPAAEAFFAKLSSSLQRYHLDNISAAKTAETRQRRIDNAISLFQQGKKR
jgi:uncharacterized protein YdeI (YjbR/CyaY-like superfamily)